ncbi:UNVERIFIED_ORG: hypothetical protein QE446_002928 [Rhizobium sp. SORGH_AS260]|jgi:hypothetical protein|nr:hypothetical protein [Rhizobium sp. RAS22]MDP9733118.1 hypothetical protein [Rhizobium sp. SORGH_AS_0285]MDP9755052.1 hypothetical protein [Rhizobium sp. SORGH_AS_0260]MDR6082291.1 hypothetical protein [Agrobacterium sp. SORGH_AS_0440]MDR6189424.1 hypothetical protein [Agrobacterium pusense]
MEMGQRIGAHMMMINRYAGKIVYAIGMAVSTRFACSTCAINGSFGRNMFAVIQGS